MTLTFNRTILAVSASLFLYGCGSTALVSTPIENIDTVPLKTSALTEAEKKNWGHADLLSDTIPGMSVDKAYTDIIKNKKGEKVIVAVLDSGMDLDHEDLDGVLWVNKDEIAGNNKDDDNNGYVDDVHGYNFLGESYNEQLEMARIVDRKLGDADLQAKAKSALDTDYQKAIQNKNQYEQILQAVQNADSEVKAVLGKDTYTKKDLTQIETEDETMLRNISILMQMFTIKDSIPEVISELKSGVKHFSDNLTTTLM